MLKDSWKDEKLKEKYMEEIDLSKFNIFVLIEMRKDIDKEIKRRKKLL